jgi:hypothetical protein
MAVITNATGAWASVTLSSNEVWQVRSGNVEVDTEATEADRMGILLTLNDSIQLTSGATVYYRLAQGSAAVIARVAV